MNRVDDAAADPAAPALSQIADFGAVPIAELAGLVLQADPSSADPSTCLGAIRACEQVLRFFSARQVRFVAADALQSGPAREAAARPEVMSGRELTAAEIAPFLGLTPAQATTRVDTAINLVQDSPVMLDLVESGLTDLWRATLADGELREVLDPGSALWEEAQDALAQKLPGVSSGQVRAAARRQVHLLDPEAAARRYAKAVRTREVRAYPLGDGMGGLQATLTADAACMVDEILDALADSCRDASRAEGIEHPDTHQQRRADALAAVFAAINNATPLPLLAHDRDPNHGGTEGNDQQGDSAKDEADQGDPADQDGAEQERCWAEQTDVDPRDAEEHVAEQADQRELDQRELHQREVDEREVDQRELHQRELHQREVDQRELDQREVEAAAVQRRGRDRDLLAGRILLPNAFTPSNPCSTSATVLGWWLPPALPTQHGRRPHLVLTMSAATLAGLDDLPADLAGHGVIPADLARKIAAQAAGGSIVVLAEGEHPAQAPPGRPSSAPGRPLSAPDRPLSAPDRPLSAPGRPLSAPGRPLSAPDRPLSAPDRPLSAPPGPASGNASVKVGPWQVWSFTGYAAGRLGDHGPGDHDSCPNRERGYRPSQAVTDQVIGLHQTCRFSGCRRRAHRCDLDHVVPYDTGRPASSRTGGSTCICDLIPLCRRHHRLKTFGGWQVRFSTRDEPYPTGTLVWTSPRGHRHVQLPPTLPGSNDWQAPRPLLP